MSSGQIRIADDVVRSDEGSGPDLVQGHRRLLEGRSGCFAVDSIHLRLLWEIPMPGLSVFCWICRFVSVDAEAILNFLDAPPVGMRAFIPTVLNQDYRSCVADMDETNFPRKQDSTRIEL
jgi:hypothetical protein